MSALEQTAAALFFCGLLAILVWLLRKGKLASFGLSSVHSQGAGQLDVIARRTLTSQHTLHLVSAAGETFLVTTHPHGAEIVPFPAKRTLRCLPADSGERESH